MFNIGHEYRATELGNKSFHTSFSAAFQSGYNSNANLSSYGLVKKRWLVDASVDLGRRDGKADVSLVVKTLTDDSTP